MVRRLEPAHLPLLLPCRLVRILRAVIEVTVLAVLHAGENFSARRTIASELIHHDDPRHIVKTFKQLVKKALGRTFVTSALNQDIQHVALLVDRSPKVMALAVDRDEHFVQMPLVTSAGLTASDGIGEALPEL